MGYGLANIDGRAAFIDGDDFYDVARLSEGRLSSEPLAALREAKQLGALADRLDAETPDGQWRDRLIGPPIPNPQKVFGVGLNYLSHADESSMEPPENPLIFTKFPSCLVGAYHEVQLRSDGCDYEGELVVVIGKPGKDIDRADAWSHVAGLMIGQDISDRPAQFSAKPPHFDLGKSFDTFGPCGPYMVSIDSFADPADLSIETWINDERRQKDRTTSLLFDVPYLIAYLSGITRLETGDLIFTGTPEGVGAASKRFLKDGDVITTKIEHLGEMVNRCVRVTDQPRLK